MKILSILMSTALVSASVMGTLANRAVAGSDTSSKVVVAVCGPNGAAQVVDADKVPVGCHVSTVNSPPASRG
jgi:hypothetical protein